MSANSTKGKIRGGVVAAGMLTFKSPVHFGGEDSDFADNAILRHANGDPYLPGTTLAGICRALLNARLQGWQRLPPNDPRFASKSSEHPLVTALFGNTDEGQSALIVFDAEMITNDPACNAPVRSFLRDGVRIDAAAGTAVDNFKFDREVLPCGVVFELRFELIFREGQTQPHEDLYSALLTLLADLLEGSGYPVRLGAKTNRGYGKATVSQWAIRRADFQNPNDAAWWLLERNIEVENNPSPKEIFQEAAAKWRDERTKFSLSIKCIVASSLLIGAYPTKPDEPDKTPVRNGAMTKNQGEQAVVPGTALAGVMRHRALRILRTLSSNELSVDTIEQQWLTPLFGSPSSQEKEPPKGRRRKTALQASRVIFDESLVESFDAAQDAVEEVQTRIHIDPFTGGVHQGPFEEQAIWSGKAEAHVTFRLNLQQPKPEEIALLMLAAKDLWLEDLTLGSGASIGRGTMRGIAAVGKERKSDGTTTEFKFHAPPRQPRSTPAVQITGLSAEQAKQMNDAVTALCHEVTAVCRSIEEGKTPYEQSGNEN